MSDLEMPPTDGAGGEQQRTRVAVVGAKGRMGQFVCQAVEQDPSLALVAAVDVEDDLNALIASQCEVAVDFTVAKAARQTLKFLAENGIHAVVGTSGLTDVDHEELRGAFVSSNCLVAPNFAIGAVLMMRFSELAAPYFDCVEIIESHHDAKLDAPSGTAIHTASRLSAGKPKGWPEDKTTQETIEGARGAEGDGNVRIHSVRMRGLVAHQEVLFGTTGQTLTIRHDTIDRSSFMPGVLMACKRISEFAGLTVGLDAFLDL